VSKEHTRQITMNIPVSLWDAVAELGHALGYDDGRGIHSPLMREIVSAVVLKWRKSPYICHSANHIVFVTADGHVFYKLVQELQLNSKRKRLPFILEMKPEKQKDFLLRRQSGMEEAAWFRSRWLLNHFSVWQGRGITGSLLSSWVDHEGTTSKSADLDIDQGPGRFVTRELVVGIQDYVQWRNVGAGSTSPVTETTFDRVDLPIDIPTRDLKISVIVDTRLYRNTGFASEEEIPSLAMEFRNREGAKFEDPAISRDPENLIAEECTGRFFGKNRTLKTEQMLVNLKDLSVRISSLLEAQADNGPILKEEGRGRIRETFKFPEHFLYYELEWPSPQFGLEVCVGWEKPAPFKI
jgi:hypothetical protein